MTYKFTEEQELWLRDLETTEEHQTKGCLHRTSTSAERPDREAGFCCLGRACVTLGLEARPVGNRVLYDNNESTLPKSGYSRLRLRNDCGDFACAFIEDETEVNSLTCLNDELGWSFRQIAAYIRANPENVFLPPEDAS